MHGRVRMGGGGESDGRHGTRRAQPKAGAGATRTAGTARQARPEGGGGAEAEAEALGKNGGRRQSRRGWWDRDRCVRAAK